jgi:hypothetical protein
LKRCAARAVCVLAYFFPLGNQAPVHIQSKKVPASASIQMIFGFSLAYFQQERTEGKTLRRQNTMAGVKVVLITGSSDGGIGAAMCAAFQEAGCRVFATARRLESMKGLEAIGCELVQLDVCDQASVRKCVDQVVAKAGRIDILVRI